MPDKFAGRRRRNTRRPSVLTACPAGAYSTSPVPHRGHSAFSVKLAEHLLALKGHTDLERSPRLVAPTLVMRLRVPMVSI